MYNDGYNQKKNKRRINETNVTNCGEDGVYIVTKTLRNFILNHIHKVLYSRLCRTEDWSVFQSHGVKNWCIMAVSNF